MIRFGREVCGDLKQAESREWWMSNGLGAYAAGNIADSLTRRYHGLLITQVNESLDRQLLLSRVEATLEIDGQLYPLSCNHWRSGAISPEGYVNIESFRLDGSLPVWVYSVAGVRIEKRIFMQPGEATTWVIFRLLDDESNRLVRLNLRLLINNRDHHSQTHSHGFTAQVDRVSSRYLQVDYTNSTKLNIQISSGELYPEYEWINDFFLNEESQRGLPAIDNHLAIANATLPMNDKHWQGIRAGLLKSELLEPEKALHEAKKHNRLTIDTTDMPDWLVQLNHTCKDFLFERVHGQNKGQSIIAGYPWFADWGRDTMIALPGLTLATGQLPVARQILNTWSKYVDQGMIPNRFPETSGQPEYNSVDASLWFILAWHQYMQAGGKYKALKKVFPILKTIISSYKKGTRYQIGMDTSNGLLHIGEANSQLTWMDARVRGIAATPRNGKPVEINALWYNALRTMQTFSDQLGDKNHQYAKMAQRVAGSFKRYIRDTDGGLYDVIDSPDGNDPSIRPNQIFALSLPWPLLDNSSARRVFTQVKNHLYTSYGLRSLSVNDENYCRVYQGGVEHRDGCYHNGPVWGWLLGHYVIAHWRVYGNKSDALGLLTPVRDHLFNAGLGSVSEIFEAEPPHTPVGAPSQAWSVATVLEAWWVINQGDSPDTEKVEQNG